VAIYPLEDLRAKTQAINMQRRPDVLNTFERTQYRKSLAIYAGVLAGLELAWLLAFARTVDQLLPAGLLFAAFAVVAWRARRSGVVIQTDDKLVVLETSWTHRLSRDSVQRFTAEVGRLRFPPTSASFLVAELHDGRLRTYKDFNAPANDAGVRDIEGVAAALNAAWHLS
jgi:hypothetical protein